MVGNDGNALWGPGDQARKMNSTPRAASEISTAWRKRTMWTRLKRLFRSIFGGIIDSAEDPEKILQQLVRDMNDELPKMRNNVADVMATEKRLEGEIRAQQTRMTDLDNKIKAAIRVGKDDVATALIAELQIAQRGLETAQRNHVAAKAASVKAREMFDNYMAQINRRQAEARQLISASKQASMQERLAQTMASFQMGDHSQTFDDMREKIANRSAAAEAKSELASTSLDARMMNIEHELANVEAQDMLMAYKQEMGVLPAASSRPALGEGTETPNADRNPGAAEFAPQERKLSE
jgi:phage shock protein A